MKGGGFPAARGFHWDAACIVLLCLLAACVFRAGLDPRAPVLLGHPTQADVTHQFYPWRAFAADELRRGSVPLWNPYVCCGQPFAAGWQSAVFYPPNLAFLILPVHVVINWGFAGHLMLAGAFTFLYLRLLGAGRFAGLVAAISFTLSSTMVLRVFAGHLSLVCAAAWFPALLLAAEGWRRGRRLSWALFGGIVFGLQILAGHPQVAYFSAAGCAFYLAAAVLFSPRGARGREAAGAGVFLAVVAPLGASLAAVQLIPGIEFVANSIRGAEAGSGARMLSFPPENLVTFLVPDALGDFVGIFCWGRRFLWGEAVYLGVLPLVMALVVLLFRRNRTTAVLACLALAPLVLVLAAGVPSASPLLEAIPGLGGVQGPTKALFIAVFALCCLAGLGAQRVLGERAARLGAAAAVLLGLAAFCGVEAFRTDDGPSAWRALVGYRKEADPRYWRVLDDPAFLLEARGVFREGMRRLSMLLTASAGALLLASRGKSNPRLAQAAIAGLVVADLWSWNARFIATVPVSACRWPSGVVRLLARGGGEWRVTRDPRSAVAGINQNIVDRIHAFEGYETDEVRLFGEFRGLFDPVADGAAGMFRSPASLKAASLASVRYLIAPAAAPDPAPGAPVRRDGAGVRIHENPVAFPRARVVHRAMVVPVETQALALIRWPGFDPRGEAVLDAAPGIVLPGGPPSAAVIARDEPREVVVRCRLDAPGVLVLADTWYPGWRATVDGADAPILRANHAFRGVALGKGAHEVRFIFRPASFMFGAWLSVLAAAGTACVLPRALRRRAAPRAGG